MSQPDSNRRVTLRDIAEKLNISHTTVSRALRDEPRFSKKLRLRVQQTAEEMGYRPDPMLSALQHYRNSKRKIAIGAELAWINQWPDPKRLRSYKELDLYWQGASEEAARCGFRLEEFLINEKISAARTQNILQARNIRGILIPPHGGVTLDWNGFDWDNYCIVRFGHSIETPRAHVVTSDQLTDGLLAFESMWNRGYRRIGLVSVEKKRTRFGAGYLFNQMALSPGLQLPPLLLNEIKTAPDERALSSWIKKNKPDAILTDVGEVHNCLVKLGYNVPGDIGLAALSVLDGEADAGIDQNSKEIGRAAVQLLISLINHNECGIPKICREVLVEGQWVDGSTLPPKR